MNLIIVIDTVNSQSKSKFVKYATGLAMFFFVLLAIFGSLSLYPMIIKDGIGILEKLVTISSLSVTVLMGACLAVAQIADTPEEKQIWKKLGIGFLHAVVVILWGSLTAIIGIYVVDFLSILTAIGVILVVLASLSALTMTLSLLQALSKY